MDLKKLKKLGCRDFNPLETLQLLSYNRIIWMTWGVPTESIKVIGTKGLLFRVNGNHYKGLILVTLSFMDLYDVHFVTEEGEVTEKIEELYFDQLSEVIDNRIEKIKEYRF